MRFTSKVTYYGCNASGGQRHIRSDSWAERTNPVGYMKNSNKPSQFNSQKVITTLKHQMGVQKAMDLINSRIQNPPSLGDLASCSGLSRTYFSYVFREITGMRLQDYLIQTRLKKAKDLLRDIDLRIKEIAYEVGFKDPNHFSRTFKKKMGVSPTRWRMLEA